MIGKIIKKIKEHFFLALLIIIILLIIILVPFLANYICCKKITADGLITYIGSIIMAILTLFTAMVAIYNNERAERKDNIIRRMSVAPEFLIKIELYDGIYYMEIRNDASYSAKTIYLYDIPILPYIKSKSLEKIRFTVAEEKNKEAIYVPKDNFEMKKDNMMRGIKLIFQDIDGRIILQEFERDSNNLYISIKEKEYLE